MNLLEFRRRSKKYSHKQLGDLVGVHQTYISQFERGLPPGPEQRARLAAALDLDPGTLLDEVVLTEPTNV